VISLGVFGAVFSAKQYERFGLHMNRARGYRLELEKRLQPAVPIIDIKRIADQASASKHPFLFKRSLHGFWIVMNLLVAVLGALLLYQTSLGQVTTAQTPASVSGPSAPSLHIP
jgi:hypothetical protein